MPKKNAERSSHDPPPRADVREILQSVHLIMLRSFIGEPMITCLYCGAGNQPSKYLGLNICQCGRSGNWSEKYHPKLLPCAPQFGTPDWLRAMRFIRYALFPVNDQIIELAAKQSLQNGIK